MTDDEADARRLSASSLAAGDPIGWFEALYAEARDGTAVVPWDRDAPNLMLVTWAAGLRGKGKRAVVVGCGTGRDAEYVASLGFATTAFDVSATAIETALARHPATRVAYEVADLFAPPASWRAAFDLVVESHNVQALPPRLHGPASAAVASLVAPGGTLLVLAFAAGAWLDQPPPWPLTRAEIEAFGVDGLAPVAVTTVETDGPRWRAEFRR